MPLPSLQSMPAQLTFADGLVGMPHLRTFDVRPVDEAPFLLLDCVEDAAFGFVAAEAETVRPGMAAEMERAGFVSAGQLVMVLLSLHGDPPAMTANLAGPLLVDPETGAGHQIVLEGDAYPLRAPITGAP